MAYPVASLSILEIQYRYKIQGQQCINVFHYQVDGAVVDGAAVLATFALDFSMNVANVLKANQTNDVTDIHLRSQWVHPVRYVPQILPVGDTFGDVLPPTESIGTCVVLKKLTDRASRSARGRIFLGGVAEASINIGTLESTFYTTITGQWATAAIYNLADATEGRFAAPVIWSYSDPAGVDEITASAVDRYARYQRRREVGRGI